MTYSLKDSIKWQLKNERIVFVTLLLSAPLILTLIGFFAGDISISSNGISISGDLFNQATLFLGVFLAFVNFSKWKSVQADLNGDEAASIGWIKSVDKIVIITLLTALLGGVV
ncbi:hypothetical protein VCHA53O466_50511 [Vibrio chagasii]|nr:hypothetical protein VCHA53O466_50511 [Vibrio chagasii]